MLKRKINLQLFAETPKEEKEKDEKPEEKKDDKKSSDNSLGEKLDKLIDCLIPKPADKKDALEVPVPKKPKLNPEEEKAEEEEKPQTKSFWKKVGEALWR